MSLQGIAAGTAVAALAVTAFFWGAGFSFALVATFAALAVVAGGIVAGVVDPGEPRIPEPQLVLRKGARREVSRAAGSLGASGGRAAATGSERLARIAARRLARHGIDLADPAHQAEAEAILGPVAYRVVIEPSDRRIAVLERAVEAVERLDFSGRSPHERGGPTS